jgi:hypothetical protein
MGIAGRDVLEPLLATSDDMDFSAPGVKLAGGGQSDAGRASDHECSVIVRVSVHA